jgi:hypothetical protein
MYGFGPPASRQARREWWRRQIQRQQESTVSVAEFCRRLGVSTVSFYAWKRRFREPPAPAPIPAQKPATQASLTANPVPTATFLPVSILAAGSTGQLEIEFANDCVVRLTGAIDPQLLRIAIRAAGRLGSNGRGTH